MGILIGIIIVTLVIAGVGGGIYVLVFRAKHKKEVLENSQMGNNLPIFGTGSVQQNQTQGLPDLGGIPNQSQGSPLASPMMNDITGGVVQNNAMSDIPQVPQAPVAPTQEEPSLMNSQEQPTVNRNFPGISPEPEAPVTDSASIVDEISTTPTNTFELGQVDPNTMNAGNLLDDTGTVGPVAGMAEDTANSATEVDISDSTVPVTRENESLEQIESELGDAAVSAETEKREEQNEIPETSIFTETSQPEPVNVPETPAAPEPLVLPEIPVSSSVQDFPNIGQSSEPQLTPSPSVPEPPLTPESLVVADFPQTPAIDSMTQSTNPADNSQDTGAQEMHI